MDMAPRLLVPVIMLLALAACGQQTAAGGGSEPPGGNYDGEWRLVSGTAPSGPIPVPRQVTLVIEGPQISGVSACNSYSGTATVDGSSFRTEGIGGTEMGCPGKRM